MNSDVINERIFDLDNAEDHPYKSVMGGKIIPYIGWFWRRVNFDTEEIWLGVIPKGADDNDTNLVGFMENNKWGYPSVKVEKEDWAKLKTLIETALVSMKPDDFKAVDDFMQKFGENKTFEAHTEWF